MKMYDVGVWIKGIGLDSYWVEAPNPIEAARLAGERIKNETDAEDYMIMDIIVVKGR